MKYILSVALASLLAFPALAQEQRGGCNKRCRDEQTAIVAPTETLEERGTGRLENDSTVEENKKEDKYIPLDHGGPDSQHGSGTR